MASKRSTQVQTIHHRAGEGHVVDMTVVSTDANSVTGQFDLGGLPVPERRFSCDAVGLRTRGTLIQLLFGQSQPIGDGLLSMLVVNMSRENATQFLRTVSGKFSEDYLASHGSAEGDEVTDFQHKADQTVVLTGSIVLAGYSGTDGCMDFYYSSPFAMHHASVIKKMAIESVVRVNLPTGLFFATLKRVQEVVSPRHGLTEGG